MTNDNPSNRDNYVNDSKKEENSNKKSMATGAMLGALVTAVSFSAVLFTLFNQPEGGTESGESSNEPLYWVAPMDPNYKRDKPGKSPMGMDLIPVYAEEQGANDAGPGAIKISPEVVNNLGVKTGVVELKNLENQIKTVGYVKYNEDLLVHLHPRVEGWVDKLFVKAEGDPIEKGQPVYELYSPALVNAQEELLLALDRNNRRLIQAAEERLNALQIPKSVIENLKKERKVSQNVTFYSPQSGVVDNLNIRQGFFVKPGTTLMSIGALDQVWVEAEIFERQVPWVKTGMPVTMKLDYLPGEDWQGQVDYVYPTLDAKTRTVKVRLKFDNEKHLLKPNMFAQVMIHSHSEHSSLVIPKQALIRTGSQDRVVLALDGGRFKSIAVKVGAQDSDSVEILDGLNEGEKIVTSAQFLIDSESSKSSDFKRMEKASNQAQSVWTSATIHSVDTASRSVNASHDAIDEWGWPEMTMNFNIAQSVDISQLTPELSLHIEITEVKENDYQISNIHIMDGHAMNGHDMDSASEQVSSATVTGVVNKIDDESRVLNISRGPIEKWNRPAATMDFILEESLDVTLVQKNAEIEFTFEIRDEFIIVDWSLEDTTDSEDTADSEDSNEMQNHEHH